MNGVPRDHPQQEKHEPEGDELAPFRGVLMELEAVRDVPPADPGATAVARRRFLNEAAGLRAARVRRPLRWALPLCRALLPSAALLVLTVVLATGLVVSAQPALPGTPLYPVKTAWEDLRLAWTPEPQARAELLVALLDERAAEIARLNAAGRPIPASLLQRLDQEICQALQSAARLSEPQMRRILQQMQAVVAAQYQTLAQALQSVPPENQAVVTQGLAVLTTAQAWIAWGLEDPAALSRFNGSDAVIPTLPPPTTAALPRPTATLGPSTRTPGPTLTLAPTSTAMTTALPTPPPPNPTEPGYTISPTGTPKPQPTSTPPAPVPSRTPAATCTSGPIHTQPIKTPGPPEQTPGSPEHTQGRSEQPTRRP